MLSLNAGFSSWSPRFRIFIILLNKKNSKYIFEAGQIKISLLFLSKTNKRYRPKYPKKINYAIEIQTTLSNQSMNLNVAIMHSNRWYSLLSGQLSNNYANLATSIFHDALGLMHSMTSTKIIIRKH
jgi:hypothetical protein